MQAKHSRTLGSIISRMAFDAERNNYTDWLSDRLFLRVLSSAGCRAETILSSLLKDWEIHRMKSRIEREIESTIQHNAPSRGTFFANLSDILDEIAGVDATLTTAHIVLMVLNDKHTISSRVLEMYGITVSAIEEKMFGIVEDEDTMVVRDPRLFGSTSSLPINIADSVRSEKKESVLARFSTDLTEVARRGNIDVVIGREAEIERLIQVLGRRKKNNPVLIGEAGVGKSAIVEGLALRIVNNTVPRSLRGKRVLSLDVASLVAGTKYRGEFEERMSVILDELRSNKDIIVFIDEIHTIVGAGSTQGSLDTANILKPALARGEVQCIGATTFDEYRQSIERDAALERRFQKITVEPTTAEQTLRILQNIKVHYEQHHSVRYTDEALVACVELTQRYIADRHFPDKAIDVMDEAGARQQLFGAEDCRVVDKQDIGRVITSITGIPVERVARSERGRLVGMNSELESVVIGQSEAVGKVVKAIFRSRSGLKDPNKPIGVFMFVGPTGVGKTHLAKELARRFFDSTDALIRIDMSEYSQQHNVSRLIGSPPGYVGYGEGGQLTEAVRRQPYSVVLFDEIEKAHSEVYNLMLQLLDDGTLTDGNGRKVDFKNTIIIMTSNVGSANAVRRSQTVGYVTSANNRNRELTAESEYRKALMETFAPEFINRIDDVVIFNTLQMVDIEAIVDLELSQLSRRAESLGYRIELSNDARRQLALWGYQPDYGVRSLKRTILERIEEPLAQMIVSGEISQGETVDIDYVEQELRLLVRAA
ncbi:MAG: ATP-dependent Clp protease ATP-binding subunit [Rikenellaceae bacterium]|nr:ATP-dependent Clp protease ATP-binding subunit [Rikenellaceae bacterium]